MKVKIEDVPPHMWVIRIRDSTFGNKVTPLKKQLAAEFELSGFTVNTVFPTMLADGYFYESMSVSHSNAGAVTLFLLKHGLPDEVSVIQIR